MKNMTNQMNQLETIGLTELSQEEQMQFDGGCCVVNFFCCCYPKPTPPKPPTPPTPPTPPAPWCNPKPRC